MMPNINSEQEQVMEAFVHQMVADKGLLEEDQKQNGKIQQELRTQLDEVMDRSLIDALPEEKLAELDKMLDAGATDDEIENFFDTAGVDFEAAMRGTMEEFRRQYLEGNNSTNNDEVSNINNTVETPAGMPVQGAKSEVPGESDVEGVAQETTVIAEEEA